MKKLGRKIILITAMLVSIMILFTACSTVFAQYDVDEYIIKGLSIRMLIN